MESGLKNVFDSRKVELYQMMSYHLGWQDEHGNDIETTGTKRHHGIACLATCYATGSDPSIANLAAASIELVNSFCQIHDDVEGGNPKRNNRDAVWWIWGPAQAINAGDGMHALARLSLLQQVEQNLPIEKSFKAIELLDKTSLELCEGRFHDLQAQEKIDLNVEDYLNMASSRTGSLYSCAMELGALISSSDESVAQSMGLCGKNIGLAIQIRNDIEEIWSSSENSENPNIEFMNKKKILPVVYAISKGTISEKRRLGEIYFKRVLEPSDISTVRKILEDMGAKEYCENLAEKYHSDAKLKLNDLEISTEGRKTILEFINLLLL